MWFTRLAISRPILIWMSLLAIAILGIQAYFRLPAELNPRVDIPTLTVTTVYPGAGPPEIETQLSKPLEDAVGTVGGVKDVYSSSQANVSILSMDFRVGTDLDAASAEVRGRIEAIRSSLPPEAQQPVVAKLDINAQPILYLGLESPALNAQQLRALADKTLRPALQRVAGVATVQVLGGEQREIRVAVDANRLARAGITLEDVVSALRASGRDIPGGGITNGGKQTDVRLAAAYTSLEAIRVTQILGSHGQGTGGVSASGMGGMNGSATANGAGSSAGNGVALPVPPLTVGEVADVIDGYAERTAINRINGRDGVSLVLTKASDASTVTVVDAVNRALAQLKPSLPTDFRSIILRDDAVTVRDALQDVNFSLVLGALLAMTVILLFLHNLRGTLIVSLAIPACVVATFLVMSLASFTLNQMTLLALSLSVGILVDDSIVVLESITRHLRDGESPRDAALNGRAEIGFADVTTTLVDVVVFVPIAFMGGIVGGFFKQFGLCIVAATLFSLVVSFSVTPMLASRWYKSGEDVEAKSGIFAPLERFYRKLEHLYRRVIRAALRRRGPVILSAIAVLALGGTVASMRLGFEFLPGTDQGQIAVSIEMPPGSSLAATDAAARQVESAVMTAPDVLATVTNVGQVLGGFGSIPQQGPQFAQINVRLKDKGGFLERVLHPELARQQRKRSDQEITTAMRHDLASLGSTLGGKITVAAVRSVTGISVPVEIQLRGPDLMRLTEFAEKLRDRMSGVPGILDPDVSVRSGKPEVRVTIDRERAASLNIPSSLAGTNLRDALSGNTDSLFRDNGQDFPIRVQLMSMQRDSPEAVKDIPVGSDAQGQPIMLADVATIITVTGPSNIERNNGQRLVTVTANLAPDTPLGNVQRLIQKEIYGLPHTDIDVHWGGEAETLDENIIPFASALILAVLLVYIVMASLFNNLGTPLVIMFVLPMALIGALGALVLTGETMSLIAAIGIIMLVGLMTRNAILLLDYTNTLRGRGSARDAAIEEAGATRLRPILMTTTATIVGMLPVALRIGRASEIRAPMAIVVIGGLLVSTLLTLVVIPVLYSLFDDWFGGRNRKSDIDLAGE